MIGFGFRFGILFIGLGKVIYRVDWVIGFRVGLGFGLVVNLMGNWYRNGFGSSLKGMG